MKKGASIVFAVLCTAVVFACSSGGSSEGELSSGRGTLSLGLTDAATDQYRAVYITIDDIQVHMSGSEDNPGNWESVEMPIRPMTVNLLDLINGVRENLGLVSLSSGHYTQMRLIIGRTPENSVNVLSQAHPYANYVIDRSTPATVRELKIPSGYATGVKIVHPFDISENWTTELILDFDAARSVVQGRDSGNWLLKPTIKVADLTESAIVTGTVTSDSAPTVGIENALVSVQMYDADAADPVEKVIIAAATLTDDNGDFQLFVAPGEYNLVVYAAGQQVSFSEIRLEPAGALVADRVLAETMNGQVDGAVSISGAAAEQYATISFRKAVNGASEEKFIEIKSINVLSDASYSIILPAPESYTVIGSTFGSASETYGCTVTENETTILDVALTTNP